MKLTKQNIDKVRHIEGFPIARDEDIIALSRPPYYTACPNPFIENFIRENGTPYDEATDDYHREPFAADVSEGKNDPIYNAHSYHTKVPHKAIMRYILHYTKPGDIVFDGFCGTGMTGVAAQMCGCPTQDLRAQIERESSEPVEWGERHAVLNDLSPAATFIAHNYNTPVNPSELSQEAERLLSLCEEEYGWMYSTRHVTEQGESILGLDGKPMLGRIQYVVWADVFVCPSCSGEVNFWSAAVDKSHGIISDEFCCPHCNSKLTKRECNRAQMTEYDSIVGKPITVAKQVPAFINYTVGSSRYTKIADEYDFDLLSRIGKTKIPSCITPWLLPAGSNIDQPRNSHGVYYAHQFFTLRNLIILGRLWELAEGNALEIPLRFVLTGIMQISSRMSRFRFDSRNPQNTAGGTLNGTLFIPSLSREGAVFENYRRRLSSILTLFANTRSFSGVANIGCSSLDAVSMPNNSVDYIFTDPPFGANINYSELSCIWESWLKVVTSTQNEAIINKTQKKALPEYQDLMEKCLATYYRVLKPGRWITIEFHNSQNAVWNAISEAVLRAGFIIADVRTLDKKQGSFKQMTSTSAVKQDLVISAYKPREAFVRRFYENAGDPEMAWEFVRQHLRNVPIVADGNRDGKLDIIAERQDYLLFDRMVAWHIMNGIPVPMDAHTFYEGLRQRFLQRDGMFFLPDQVNEYDEKRAHMELDVQQLAFLVTDEKNAIAWLNYILRDGPKTYQEIQPVYLQELHQSKQEKMPELLDMLRENFVQDEKGAWYVPDLSNAADLAKVRRKALLKEFYDSCVPGKAKLKVFRMEAIRAGFDECWKARDFKTIVAVGEKLPEAVLQEDPALLMYYDNACARV
ncbi:MAG: DNA methylase [Clostridia bacterium]|nr:DNA methylase [Clostridia bacterium]